MRWESTARLRKRGTHFSGRGGLGLWQGWSHNCWNPERVHNLLYSHQIQLKEDQEKVQNVFFGKSHSIYSIILVYVKRENKMLLLNLNYDLYRENVMLSLHLYKRLQNGDLSSTAKFRCIHTHYLYLQHYQYADNKMLLFHIYTALFIDRMQCCQYI